MESFGIRIYKEYFNFAAAHFLIFEDGSREELHGHNYQVQMSVDGALSEGNDVFIDFLHIKPLLKRVCDSIDHRTLLPENNPFLSLNVSEPEVLATFHTGDRWIFPRRDVIILPLPNTSVERLSQYICKQTLLALAEIYPDAKIQRVAVSVEESRGQCAEYRLHYPEAKHLTSLDIIQNSILV
jgi:6-pyruvoyltetrahydropterin/6-carboxytetrahydropterin synthase